MSTQTEAQQAVATGGLCFWALARHDLKPRQPVCLRGAVNWKPEKSFQKIKLALCCTSMHEYAADEAHHDNSSR